MTAPLDPRKEERLGIAYAGLSYIIWGIVPLYWKLVVDVSSPEVVGQRIFWSGVFAALVTAFSGHLRRALSVLKTPRVFGVLALTGVLITINWTIYIYCVESNQLVESALGYYLTPLVSFALGFAFFGERLSKVRIFCIVLASIGLVLQVIALGHFPWIAPCLALSFGLYGYFRKRAPVTGMDGLFIETALLFPFAFGFLLYWGHQHGEGLFSHGWVKDLLLLGTGPLTAIPLAMFAAGARRVSMTTLGFLQYLAPSLTLLMAVFGFHEDFSTVDLVSFGCVWAALVIVALEGRGSRLFARFSGPKP
jgi:chloramphenicol-sensitive protein RarD